MAKAVVVGMEAMEEVEVTELINFTNVMGAQVAGVGYRAVDSPPQAEHRGWPDPRILATRRMLGVAEVCAGGGAGGAAVWPW